MVALLAACSSTSICSGEVGPETVHVDASAWVDEETTIVVCLMEQATGAEYCGQEGSPTVSVVASNDYQVEWNYYVTFRQGNTHVVPSAAGGTHSMKCEATTTNIVLTRG